MADSLQEQIRKLFADILSLAVVGGQWGDEGKGKDIDLLAFLFDIIARGNGGPNAGHTVCIGQRHFAFHLIPSGILHDAKGKINLLGHGVAFDPTVFCRELDALDEPAVAVR